VNLYFSQQNRIDDEQIVSRLAKDGLSGTTPERRKSTVKSWINWVVDNLKDS
jgi:site-specific recombinase XerC